MSTRTRRPAEAAERQLSRAAMARPESERIDFLLHRDGAEATRIWVERTARMYEAGLAQPHNYVSDPHYRALFERAVREFNAWLSGRGGEPAPERVR